MAKCDDHLAVAGARHAVIQSSSDGRLLRGPESSHELGQGDIDRASERVSHLALLFVGEDDSDCAGPSMQTCGYHPVPVGCVYSKRKGPGSAGRLLGLGLPRSKRRAPARISAKRDRPAGAEGMTCIDRSYHNPCQDICIQLYGR